MSFFKLIIAGGRDYHLDPWDFDDLDTLHKKYTVIREICGLARGADQGGKVWAQSRGIYVREFKAFWQKYGNYAGPQRNERMAQYATAVVLFPGGKGTQNMFETAIKYKLEIFDWRQSR